MSIFSCSSGLRSRIPSFLLMASNSLLWCPLFECLLAVGFIELTSVPSIQDFPSSIWWWPPSIGVWSPEVFGLLRAVGTRVPIGLSRWSRFDTKALVRLFVASTERSPFVGAATQDGTSSMKFLTFEDFPSLSTHFLDEGDSPPSCVKVSRSETSFPLLLSSGVGAPTAPVGSESNSA